MNKSRLKNETITTVGVVIPVDWKADGSAIAYALSSYDEKEYLIDIRTELGKKLSTVEKQKIRVTGTLGRIINNRRMISVKSYEPLLASNGS